MAFFGGSWGALVFWLVLFGGLLLGVGEFSLKKHLVWFGDLGIGGFGGV